MAVLLRRRVGELLQHLATAHFCTIITPAEFEGFFTATEFPAAGFGCRITGPPPFGPPGA